MPHFHKKGPHKKSEYYVKDKTLEKPTESRNESLRYKALENKVFYFDFKNTGTAAWLEKEIRKLGGRVEYFFGKEVQYLITDKPQTRDAVIPPCSPFSNAGPSPFSRPDTSQSMRDAGPCHSEWAYSEQWKKPQASSQHSRASKLMEMASNTKSQGSCDVLARAKERGTMIKTVEQLTSWLNIVHKKLGTKLSRDNLKETPKNPSKKLRGQYIKVEDGSHKYKPQVLDAPQWQTIDCTALSDESPFNTEKRRLTRKQAHEQTKPSVCSILKKEAHGKKKSTYLRRKDGKKETYLRRKGGGKCEGCNVRFEKLETHLTGDQHLKYAKKDKNFDAIDQLMSEGLSLEAFHTEQQELTILEKSARAMKHVLSPHSEGSTEPLDPDGPCTRARKLKYHHQDSPSQPPIVEQMLAPSPKQLAGLPELENNYYLRSTPRKLAGMLDEWDTLQPQHLQQQVSQISALSDGVFLQCQSLDLFSSQGQITAPDTRSLEYEIKRPKTAPSPAKTAPSPACRGPTTRSNSPSRSRNNSASRVNSPSKRSPRILQLPTKRRVVNHS